MEELTPPQPIPYPHSKFIKRLYRIPILLYRLGLSHLFGRYVLILSTFGRKTGNIHRTPVEYFRSQRRFFVMSGFGTNPDWFQNIQKDPHVSLQTDQSILYAIARKPQTDGEWDSVMTFLRTSPVSRLSRPDLKSRLDRSEVRDAVKTWPILTFDTTDESCPTPLESDLLWAWPLILIGVALVILFHWLDQRKKEY